MPVFDIRTTFLFPGLLYLLWPAMPWVVLAGQHSRQVALRRGGGLLFGGGLVLTGLSGSIGHYAAIDVSVLLRLASHYARIHALRLDLGIAEQHSGTLNFANAAAEHGGGTIVELQLPNLDHT